ncbi:MAG: hypothetical protein HN742_39180 [Lentisphaerae bacterium]|nr:hypothetical protein [Lentisphaerota bacterium]MBT4814126.1 hypothetical protein [Lentisphaerota bacterium]MBT5609977.1 hypothetical protein [Lentisphaerota bacterium]MBT7060636.1 hypothetical protein [Lentisphaerota bacterium]MBT7847956.1 hypothetical protein [Lentisphaerota bacterium]
MSDEFLEATDLPHVRYVSHLFLMAMEQGMLEFSLRRTDSWFTISSKGESEDLHKFARCPSCGRHLDTHADQLEAVSAGNVWSRILTMADMGADSVDGTIGISLRTRYPGLDWTIDVRRPKPDVLDFQLRIARVYLIPGDGTQG